MRKDVDDVEKVGQGAIKTKNGRVFISDCRLAMP